MKMMENSENIKFSSRILSCSVIFTEKLQILRKMIKVALFSVYILENIKFYIERPYRLVPLLEKLRIFHCSIEELVFNEKLQICQKS